MKKEHILGTSAGLISICYASNPTLEATLYAEKATMNSMSNIAKYGAKEVVRSESFMDFFNMV